MEELQEKKLAQQNYHDTIVSTVFEKGLSMAMWRLPQEQTIHALVADKVIELPDKFTLEELPTGFIFSPFNKKKSSLFLKGDFRFTFQNGQATPETRSSMLAFQECTGYSDSQRENKKQVKDIDEKPADEFVALVKKSIEEIEKGSFEKVVLSRVKRITLSPSFNIASTFDKLCRTYPHALISFVHIEGTGTWMGASPEMLVHVENKETFKTVALAGTKKYVPETTIKSISWTQKEIEEQALVERYIIGCFKKIRLREYEEQGPKTVVAGNLAHLRSDFVVDMKATNFPQLGSVMLELLHPTSAVCGTPMDASFEFITQHEGYDREFYAGYLGPVNFNNDIHVYVNLRCMQITGDNAIIYAGAGITRDSTPQDEWAETETKLDAFLNSIR